MVWLNVVDLAFPDLSIFVGLALHLQKARQTRCIVSHQLPLPESCRLNCHCCLPNNDTPTFNSCGAIDQPVYIAFASNE